MIVEGLDLSQPPPGEYDFCCLPYGSKDSTEHLHAPILISRDNGDT